MRVELDIPIKDKDVDWVRLACENKKEIDFRNKHGKVERAKILGVEWRFKPQGIGNGYFMDLMFDGDDTTVSEYLANQIADKKAAQ